MTQSLRDFDIQRTREDGVPAGADVPLTIHWGGERKKLFLYSQKKMLNLEENEAARGLTGDAFLQALVETTQANLVQQTGVESLKGLHIFQPCHNYVNIFPRALCWSGGINRRGQCTEHS